MDAVGRSYSSTQSKGRIQFGGGKLKECLKEWHYVIGINEKKVAFQIAEAEDNIPGLLGADYMAKWRMVINFRDNTFQSHGRRKEGTIHESTTRHPCIHVFDFPKTRNPSTFP